MSQKDYYLKKLNNILQEEDIPSNHYSLNGYLEEAVCLEEKSSSFIVYSVERGNKYDLKEHPTTLNACLDIISRLSETYRQENELINKLLY